MYWLDFVNLFISLHSIKIIKWRREGETHTSTFDLLVTNVRWKPSIFYFLNTMISLGNRCRYPTFHLSLLSPREKTCKLIEIIFLAYRIVSYRCVLWNAGRTTETLSIELHVPSERNIFLHFYPFMSLHWQRFETAMATAVSFQLK